MLEFAIILPFVSLVLFGIVQYGLIFAAFISLRNAAATVARYAVLANGDKSAAAVTNVARDAIAGILSVDNADFTGAACTPMTLAGGTAYRCAVTYNYKTIFPVPGVGADGRFVIVAESTMK